MGRGVSGVGIGVATTGGVLMYAGFRGISPLDALKQITKGQLTPVSNSAAIANSPGGSVFNQQVPNGTTTGSGSFAPTCSGLVAYGNALKSEGFTVSEHPSFGVVHPVHAPGSQHYLGRAIDVNHGAGTSAAEQAALRPLVARSHAMGFRVIFMGTLYFANGKSEPWSDHYDHLHIDISGSTKCAL